MTRLARLAGAVAIAANWLILAGTVSAQEPNLGDICSLMPAGVSVWNQSTYQCSATAPSARSGLPITISIDGPLTDPDVYLLDKRDEVLAPGNWVPSYSFGNQTFSGSGGTDYQILFRRDLYVVWIMGWTEDQATVAAYAAEIDQNLIHAVSGVSPTASLSTSPPSVFGVGLGCGVREDASLRLLACIASPYDQAADAVLVYEWRLDGVTRPETGSTMQVDIVRENLPAGNHVIGVTVTDTTNNLQAFNSTSLDTTTAAFAVSLTCGYSESQGTYELACSATAANAPPNSVISYAWTVNGTAVGTTGDTMTRSVGQGPVQVTVVARDSVSGQQTNTGSFFVTINPAGTLTNLLTLGQTSDPQNVVDALAGTAAVALVVGAAAAIGSALAGAAGALGGAGSAGAGGSAPAPTPRSAPLNAQPMGSETPASAAPSDPFTQLVEGQQFVRELFTPTEGATPSATPPSETPPSAGATEPTTGSQPSATPTTDTTAPAQTEAAVGEAASDLLAAEAGKVPAPSLDNLEKWRALSGFPNTPEGTFRLTTLLNELAMRQAAGQNPDTDLFLKMLREQALAQKPPTASPTPSTPNPDTTYEDAANLLDRTDLEWQYDLDRTKLPQPPPGESPAAPKE